MGKKIEVNNSYDDRLPWEMQEGETSKAFEAFKLYRNMAPRERSIRAVAKMLNNPKMRTIYNWSYRFEWAERVKAFDSYNDTMQLIASRKQASETLKRQARQASQVSGLFTKITLELQKRLSNIENGKTNLETMDIATLLETTVKTANSLPKLLETERVALGIHPKINIAHKVDLTNLSDEELAEIVRGE